MTTTKGLNRDTDANLQTLDIDVPAALVRS